MQFLDDNKRVVSDAKSLSSGTIATLTGLERYDQLDAVQAQFVVYCQQHVTFVTWQNAWEQFAKNYHNWDGEFPPNITMNHWSNYLYFAHERERNGQRYQVIQAKRLIRHYIHQNYSDYRRRGKGNRAWRRLREAYRPTFLPLVSIP